MNICRDCDYNVADYGDYYFCQAKGKLVQCIETCEYRNRFILIEIGADFTVKDTKTNKLLHEEEVVGLLNEKFRGEH